MTHLTQQIRKPWLYLSNVYAPSGVDNRFLQSTGDFIGTTSANFINSHFIATVVLLILISYVVAAGVEETMKHFIVKNCRFPVPLKDPHTVLVYFMSGALGFATFENIEYIFGKDSPIPGFTLFEGELLILLMRVLMPIHVICSVIQAVGVSKVSLYEITR